MTNSLSSPANGSLTESIAQVVGSIRSEPTQAAHRRALAHLRLIANDHAGALQQLQAAACLDSNYAPEALLLRVLAKAERQRTEVFAGRLFPDLLAPAPEWMSMLLKALRAGEDEAADLRRKALEMAPASAGRCDDPTRFDCISDGDERLGPVLEVCLGSVYCWVPFSGLRSLEVYSPRQAVDLVWAQVDLQLEDGTRKTGFMPTRYPIGRDQSGWDSDLLLGRRTEWSGSDETGWLGKGLRCWLIDGDFRSVFEVGQVEFDRQSDT